MNELNRASLTNEYGDELLLTGWSLKGDLRGMAFEATLDQSFVNSTGNHSEIVYNFPLPWGAELLGLEAQVGEKRFVGAVIGKKESEAQYEESLSKGDSAILLERNVNNDYTLNLGGIKPNERVTITIRYGQLVRFTKSGLRLSIPTVIAPRFGDPMRDASLKQHQVTESSLEAEYGLNLSVSLHGDWADSSIESPSHSIKIGQVADGARKVSLSKESFLDRDFVLSLDKPEQCSVAMMVPDYANEGSNMVLAAFRPDMAVEQAKHVNAKILVDCSGSMEGDSIDAARKSIQAFVTELTENDHFSLSKFGNMALHRSKGLWTATEPAKKAAQRWIESLDADMGGTEMGGALLETFDISSKEPADVLLVTDGDIHAIDHVIELAKESKHRLFIVGIGASPSESHLRRMAEETLGACDFVAPGEDVAPAIANMFARLRTSAVRGLKVNLPFSVIPAWVSPMEKVAYDGDTVYAFVRYPGLPAGAISLTGQMDDGSVVTLGTVNLPSTIEPAPDLSRLAVANYANTMIRKEGKHAGSGQKLAEEYQLVSDQTNFFMVIDRGDEKADDMPELYKVSQMVPAGYGGIGSVLRASPMYCMSSSSSQVDFAQYDLPPGMRSSRQSISTVCRSSKSVSFGGRVDIPAFLRVEEVTAKDQDSWELDVCDCRLFKDTLEYEGMTPLGLREWVRHTVVANWPVSYRGLIEIGVPEFVSDWLELLIAVDADSDERTAVATFLYAFLSPSVEQVLYKSVVDFESSRKGTDRFLVNHDLNQIDVNAYVFSDVIKAMNQSEDLAWPNCMFDMELS